MTDKFTDDELERGRFQGVIKDLPAAKYHSLKNYFSSSDLKFIQKSSPYHFNVMRMSGLGQVKQSDDMLFGSLVHTLLLTPDDFADEYLVLPTLDRRTKVGREAYLLACDTAKGRTVVDADMVDRASAAVRAVYENSEAVKLLGQCFKEVSYFWKCPFSGLHFRSRVDAVCDDYMIEVKTSRSAHPSAFERQAFNMHYDLSATHYMEGLRITGNDKPRTVYFLVVENEAPYATQIYKADDSFMESGHSKWLDCATRLETSIATEKWHGYSVEPVLPLSAPRWAGKNVAADTEGVIDGI